MKSTGMSSICALLAYACSLLAQLVLLSVLYGSSALVLQWLEGFMLQGSQRVQGGITGLCQQFFLYHLQLEAIQHARSTYQYHSSAHQLLLSLTQGVKEGLVTVWHDSVSALRYVLHAHCYAIAHATVNKMQCRHIQAARNPC